MRAVDYAPNGAVDYGPAALWISQHFVLGRIYPGLTALWITRAVLAVD